MQERYHFVLVRPEDGDMAYLKERLRVIVAWELGGVPSRLIRSWPLLRTDGESVEFLLAVPCHLGAADYVVGILEVWSEEEQVPFFCEFVGSWSS